MNRSKEGICSDYPPFSRLFVICGNNVEHMDLREEFSKFGEVEDVAIPRDHYTNQVKGIAYVKFAKTSQAAAAQRRLNNFWLKGCARPMKVVVACNRSNIQDGKFEEICKRLFITCAKTDTEDTLYEHFKIFGNVTSIVLQRDRSTGMSRGFAYVSYAYFTEAAKAFEEADKVYNVVFAKPKERVVPTLIENNMSALANTNTSNINKANMYNKNIYNANNRDATALTQAMNVESEGYTRVCALCSNYLLQHHIEALFDLIPGMMHFQYTRDLLHNCPKIFVTYSNPISAKYAVQKLNNFEFPPGEWIQVKPDTSETIFPKTKSEIPTAINNLKMAMSSVAGHSQPDLKELVDAIAKASSLVKSATTGDTRAVVDDLSYCSVTLPPQQAVVHIDSPVVKRCFLVLAPQPPPQTVLLDVFCRFGNLITVYSIPGKTVGYANYASAESADEAIKTLHGATLCGVRMKVMEADDKNTGNRKRKLND